MGVNWILRSMWSKAQLGKKRQDTTVGCLRVGLQQRVAFKHST